VSIFSAVWLAAVAVFVIILFVLLGVLIDPIAVAPYAIALLGIVSCCVALYAKLTRFATRVRRAVQKRIEVEKKRLRRVPPILLDAMIERNVDQAMHENGLSFPAIVIKIFFFACFLAAVYVFLFVGFSAFTDTSSWVAGAVNAGISAILAIGAQQALAKDGEEQDVKDDVDEMQARVMRSVIKVMEMVAKQMDLAMRLFTKMKKGMNQDASEGEASTVDVSLAKI
jgi:membrane protein implicated in regulation of membrane protease activity